MKKRIKNKSDSLRMILFPMFLIFVIGISLKTAYSPINFTTEKIDIFSQSDKVYSDFKNYIDNDKVFNKIIVINRVKSISEGKKYVTDGNITALIQLSNNYTIINTYVYKMDYFETSYIKELSTSYENKKKFNFSSEGNNVKEVALNLNSKIPTSKDYYGVTMLVLMLFYCAYYGSALIGEDDEADIRGRIAALPINKSEYLTGKIIGSSLLVFLQSVFIIVLSSFFYKINWGNNPINLFFIVAIFSFFVINFGIFVRIITGDKALTSFIINILIPIFTLIGGGYLSSTFTSDALNKISFISPSFAVQNLIFKSIYNYNMNYNCYYYEIIILAIAMFLINIFIGRRKV